jgi:hypothetical protein
MTLSATANALSSIKREVYFPDNVFTQTWDDYLFFESYIVFDGNFIEAKDLLLEEEGSSCIALVNLGNAPSDSDVEPRSMFLDRSTTFSEYFSMLKGDGSSSNWLYLMDRYVCASDKGSWCVYCEKQNDVAVIAVRHTLPTSTRLKLETVMEAESIRTLFTSQNDRIFDSLVPTWRYGLAAEYVPK